MQEVGPLNELVGELGERHALALAVEAFLDRVFGHHVIDRNALADIADELQKRELLHPVVVVDQLGRIRFVGREVDQPLELPADTLLIRRSYPSLRRPERSAYGRNVGNASGSSR